MEPIGSGSDSIDWRRCLLVGDILVTFVFLSAAVGLFGVGLLGASEIVGRIEDRRNEAAYQDWVEKYGESGWK